MHNAQSLWKVTIIDDVYEEDLPEYPKKIQEKITKKINDILPVNPKHGDLLSGDMDCLRKLKISSNRIIYILNEVKKEVIIIAIRPRKTVYNSFDKNIIIRRISSIALDI